MSRSCPFVLFPMIGKCGVVAGAARRGGAQTKFETQLYVRKLYEAPLYPTGSMGFVFVIWILAWQRIEKAILADRGERKCACC